MNDDNYVVILDNVGRTIIGKSPKRTASRLSITNPTVIMVGFNEKHQPKAQMLPVFFRDLLGDPNSKVVAEYNMEQITLMTVVPSKAMIESYERLHEKLDLPKVGVEIVEKEVK